MKMATCAVCGAEFERTATNVKYCPDCREAVYREQKREHSRRYRRTHRGRKPAEKPRLCQWKPDTRGIGECPRWKECAYGAEDEIIARTSGACQRLVLTGRTKVVIGPDGQRMVEPAKSCRFFEPREEEE